MCRRADCRDRVDHVGATKKVTGVLCARDIQRCCPFPLRCVTSAGTAKASCAIGRVNPESCYGADTATVGYARWGSAGWGATFAATAYVERAKWRRTIDTRWDDKRLIAYSEYGNAVKTKLEVLFRRASERGLPNLTTPADEPLAPNALADAEAERTVKWEQVLLLGSPETIAAARRWHMAVYDFGFMVVEETPSEESFLRQYRLLGSLRNDFYSCARTDLGIRGVNLPSEGRNWIPPYAHLSELPSGDCGPLVPTEVQI